jgi:pimeloyl-ACP methyl ester carboxylesterase
VIDPFTAGFSEESFGQLRRRIAATRWPTRELVDDRSQGVQLATLQELAHYWGAEYDFGRVAGRLNAVPQFTTEIDGVDIHFIHAKSTRDDAFPVIITHGWPGSVVEMLDVIDPLTAEGFDLVIPSLPGYGLSSEPREVGWDPARIARAWAELMRRLGYTRYVAQGGDVGAAVTDAMGRQAPEGLVGFHLNFLRAILTGVDPGPPESEQEREALEALKTFKTSGSGYFLEQGTRPQTIGYALLNSPVALAAWMLDHDTDSYYKISRAFVEGLPAGNLTRDHILDNITLYWLTGTGASAAREYWEGGHAKPVSSEVSVPVGFTTFPGEIFRPSRRWAEKVYPTLVYYNEVDRGGHFAAWEEPELFAAELGKAFSSIWPAASGAGLSRLAEAES